MFDGAHLVVNFEKLNPGRNYFGKYYDLFADVGEDTRTGSSNSSAGGAAIHFMNEAEIRWIVEQIFVGNRLSRGEARHRARPPSRPQGDPLADHRLRQLGRQHHPAAAGAELDRRHLMPTSTRSSIRGQRIIYMIHEKVGHLGIFVSSSIAKKEHTRSHLDHEDHRGAVARAL